MDAWHLDPTLLSDLYNSLDQFAEANRITVPPRTSKSRLHREDIGSLISGQNKEFNSNVQSLIYIMTNRFCRKISPDTNWFLSSIGDELMEELPLDLLQSITGILRR
ncbi:hypothetical protein V1477_015962 [Vespula maculifrons]|uniref:Uncharacterized protein n=1 Tax=Vespula maculifrons TaxID=7453 RepID=A0ABD2BBN5_VESMC